ncbi:hypothetical protein C5B96_16780 [Subtercola sp. Z020]|nr:hypothetical protein C5B96_16780 [Subtercola sp. Z020]
MPASGGTIAAPSWEAEALGRVTVLEVGAEAPRSARFGIDARPLSAADTATAAAAAVARALVGTAAAKQAAARGVGSEGTGGAGAARQDVPAAGSTAGGEDGGAAEVLVLGSEEFISVPLAIADELGGGGARAGRVRFSTTTRSPIAPLDRADYAIASAITFQSHDRTHDGFGTRFAYNLTRGGRRFDAIVFVPEPEADRERMLAPDGVVEALRRVTDHVMVAHLVPHEPHTEAATSQPLPGTAPAPATTAAAPAPAPDERRLP